MQLMKLVIERGSGYDWDIDKPLHGEITLCGDKMTTKFQVNEKISKQIIKLISKEVKDSAKAMSEVLIADLTKTIKGDKLKQIEG